MAVKWISNDRSFVDSYLHKLIRPVRWWMESRPRKYSTKWIHAVPPKSIYPKIYPASARYADTGECILSRSISRTADKSYQQPHECCNTKQCLYTKDLRPAQGTFAEWKYSKNMPLMILNAPFVFQRYAQNENKLHELTLKGYNKS